jgi:hypothetical protein
LSITPKKKAEFAKVFKKINKKITPSGVLLHKKKTSP